MTAPSLIVAGPEFMRAWRKEIAANAAARMWAGANWRRIKREMNKARKRTR